MISMQHIAASALLILSMHAIPRHWEDRWAQQCHFKSNYHQVYPAVCTIPHFLQPLSVPCCYIIPC